MAYIPDQSELIVEGHDDKHAIIHLLEHNGVSFNPDPPVRITVAENDEAVLDRIVTAVKAGANRRIGFVMDIDKKADDRWRQILHRLNDPKLVELSVAFRSRLPDKPQPTGTIIEIPEMGSQIGFWLMPDNQMDLGKLEDLLATLIDGGDPLRAFAETSTKESRNHDAKFAVKDQIKAVLHTWLAWQEKPGLPYGTAIKAKYFASDSQPAQSFVTWFKTLFSLQ